MLSGTLRELSAEFAGGVLKSMGMSRCSDSAILGPQDRVNSNHRLGDLPHNSPNLSAAFPLVNSMIKLWRSSAESITMWLILRFIVVFESLMWAFCAFPCPFLDCKLWQTSVSCGALSVSVASVTVRSCPFLAVFPTFQWVVPSHHVLCLCLYADIQQLFTYHSFSHHVDHKSFARCSFQPVLLVPLMTLQCWPVPFSWPLILLNFRDKLEVRSS